MDIKNLKFYRVQARYTEPCEIETIIAAPTAKDAIEITQEQMPKSVSDLDIYGCEEVTETDEMYPTYVEQLNERLSADAVAN